MRGWLLLLGGMLAWTGHFFAVYGIASLLPGRPEADWLVVAATALALAAAAWLLVRAARAVRHPTGELDRWLASAGVLGCALALVAIFYQGLPALIG